MKPLLSPLAAIAILSLAGCDRGTVVIAPATPVPEPVAKTKTLETSRLGSAVDAYERNSNAENLADVKKALADLDSEIAELEALVAKRSGSERDEAAAKLHNLQTYRTAETARFTAAQAKTQVGLAPSGDARTGAEKVEDTAKNLGNSIEDAARRTGGAIKDAVK